MSEQLLAVLRIGLLGLIYLFFLRVLHAVWVEVNGPRRARRARPPVPASVGATVAPAPATRVAPPPRAMAPALGLRVVEPATLAGGRFALAGECTIGRAPTCDIVLDDTYVSQVHARLLPAPDGWVVEDLLSTNGTYVNRAKVTAPIPLRAGDRLQVGNVVLELG